MVRPNRSIGILCFLVAASFPAFTEEDAPLWSIATYVQKSWPKQTETNRQIKEDINGTLGTHFKTWDDVDNLNLGVVALRQVAPTWKLGVEVDWSSGSINGTQNADALGAGQIHFDQTYHTYADFQIMAQWRPLADRYRVAPFVGLGVGMAYESDSTTLDYLPGDGSSTNLLTVDNHGWFPILNIGLGTDLYLGKEKKWFLEAEVGYTWARLTREATAYGPNATGPTMHADTDDTGPNILLGVGRRF